MIANVSVLPRRLSLTSAMAKLPSDSYGVIVTKTGMPVAVVTGTDLASLKDKGVRTLTQAVRHLERPLITGSQIEMKTVADVVLKQMRQKASGSVRLPPTVILDKMVIAGVLPDTNLIDWIGSLPDVDVPQEGRFKGQIRLGPQMAFRELVVGAGRSAGGGGGGGPVGPPPQINLGGPGRSTEVICAEPDCGYVNTLFRVPKPGSKKVCQNPALPSHFLKI